MPKEDVQVLAAQEKKVRIPKEIRGLAKNEDLYDTIGYKIYLKLFIVWHWLIIRKQKRPVIFWQWKYAKRIEES